LIEVERNVLSGEANERARFDSIVLDEDSKNSTCSQKCTNVGEVFARRPVLYLLYSRPVRDSTFLSTAMPNDYRLWGANRKLLAIKSSSNYFDALKNSIEIVEMFPNKSTDTGFTRNSLVSATRCLVPQSGAFNGDVVNERNSYMRDFFLESEGDVAMHDPHSVGVAHWNSGKSFGA
jgi:hypothetical protein